MVTEERAERALAYLIKITDDTELCADGARRSPLAIAVQEALMAEHMRKHVWAIEWQKIEGAQGKRDAEAYASSAYRAAVEEMAASAARLEVLRARINSAKIAIEVWRSQNANRRGPNL